MEFKSVNIFKEAREQAGLDIDKAAKVIDDPLCNRVTISKVESSHYPRPQWAHIYLSELRRIAYESSRMV